MTRSGQPVGHNEAPPGDPYWRRYICGADEVARRLRLPRDPRSVLDIGGSHGWYSAQLCRRYPRLTATVLDLPGSAAIGREIIARAGMADRVEHRDGDATTDDLDCGYDAVLCFNLAHHLTSDQTVGIFGRIYEALAPGGLRAVMDAFAEPHRRTAGAANFLGLVRLPRLRVASKYRGAVVRLAPRGRVRRAWEDPHSPVPSAGHECGQQEHGIAVALFFSPGTEIRLE